MKNKIKIYKDGAYSRWHNKSVSLKEVENGFYIQFRFVDEEPENPACRHTCLKGKVRQTEIKMSEEALQKLITSYLEYKKNENRQKHTNNKKTK